MVPKLPLSPFRTLLPALGGMRLSVVNERIVSFDYKLQSNDRVRIIKDSSVVVDRTPWLSIAVTTHAKKKIMEHLKEINKEK